MIFTTVEEEILSALEHRGLEAGVIEERLASVMSMTHLTELKDRSPHNLSGGQKQRAALAATLALGNDILILDEPTSELDEHATRRIVHILDNLKQSGKTILLIEHKFQHFRAMVDTLVVMENGGISASGNPDEVLSDPRIRSIVIPDFTGIRKRRIEVTGLRSYLNFAIPLSQSVTSPFPTATSLRSTASISRSGRGNSLQLSARMGRVKPRWSNSSITSLPRPKEMLRSSGKIPASVR